MLTPTWVFFVLIYLEATFSVYVILFCLIWVSYFFSSTYLYNLAFYSFIVLITSHLLLYLLHLWHHPIFGKKQTNTKTKQKKNPNNNRKIICIYFNLRIGF